MHQSISIALLYDPRLELSSLCTHFVISNTEAAAILEYGYAADPVVRIRLESQLSVPTSLARESLACQSLSSRSIQDDKIACPGSACSCQPPAAVRMPICSQLSRVPLAYLSPGAVIARRNAHARPRGKAQQVILRHIQHARCVTSAPTRAIPYTALAPPRRARVDHARSTIDPASPQR